MWDLIRANKRRSVVIVVAMALLLLVLGFALGELVAAGGGRAGLAGAAVLWLVMTLITFSSGDKILLSASGAHRIQKKDHPVLWNVVEEMTVASGLSRMPDVYILDEEAPNAFATGRGPETAAVAVTAGLLERLDRDELQGVIAHEIGHINNRDILYMTVVGIMMGTIVLLAEVGRRMHWYGGPRRRTSSDRDSGGLEVVILIVGLLLMILAPLLAQFMYMAMSRQREYLADASGALYTRYPEGLASALEKIAGAGEKLRRVSRVTAPMYIVNPLQAGARRVSGLLSTHPPTEERVRILRGLSGASILSLAGYDAAFRKVTGRAVGVVPAGSLKALAEVEPRGPSQVESNQTDRVRQTTDALWHAQGFHFIDCNCGTRLKVPPALGSRTIDCPHCGQSHRGRAA